MTKTSGMRMQHIVLNLLFWVIGYYLEFVIWNL